MKNVVILGSTGSIGTQAIKVCKNIGYKVIALSANTDAKTLIEQARELLPRHVVLTDKNAFEQVKSALADLPIEVLLGSDALCTIATLHDSDITLNALSGVVGLAPTIAALKSGKNVALANKEALVAGGELVINAAKSGGGRLIPVDSEHTAIFQCIQGEEQNKLRKIILTASGGPFLGKTKEELHDVSLNAALNHPKWSMGRKITVDSATLMNKGLELIECIWNFGVKPCDVEVIIHPETIVHSAVEFVDGSIIAQMSTPDMGLSIQYALTYPQRFASQVEPLNFSQMGVLTFQKPDMTAFPCLALAIEAITKGGLLPCVLNGANEVAVQSFLNEEIKFSDIYTVVSAVMAKMPAGECSSLERVLSADEEARGMAWRFIKERL